MSTNSLAREITIVSEGRDLLVVAPRSVQKVNLLRTTMLLLAVDKEGTIDEISLVENHDHMDTSSIRTRSKHTYVWNVGQRNCYVESVLFYADQSEFSSLKENLLPNSKLFSTDAEFVFELAPEILSTSSRNPSDSERIRRQLMSTDCDENNPL